MTEQDKEIIDALKLEEFGVSISMNITTQVEINATLAMGFEKIRIMLRDLTKKVNNIDARLSVFEVAIKEKKNDE